MAEDSETKSEVITRFTEFLEAFGRADVDERRAFLDFISPQSRLDLLHLADALHAKMMTERVERESE